MGRVVIKQECPRRSFPPFEVAKGENGLEQFPKTGHGAIWLLSHVSAGVGAEQLPQGSAFALLKPQNPVWEASHSRLEKIQVF